MVRENQAEGLMDWEQLWRSCERDCDAWKIRVRVLGEEMDLLVKIWGKCCLFLPTKRAAHGLQAQPQSPAGQGRKLEIRKYPCQMVFKWAGKWWWGSELRGLTEQLGSHSSQRWPRAGERCLGRAQSTPCPLEVSPGGVWRVRRRQLLTPELFRDPDLALWALSSGRGHHFADKTLGFCSH